MTNLREMLDRRPVDPEVLETHKERMLEQLRAYRLRELTDEPPRNGERPGGDL